MQTFKQQYVIIVQEPVPDCDIKHEVQSIVKAGQVGRQSTTLEAFSLTPWSAIPFLMTFSFSRC